jgi:hypothetical protein
MLIDLFVASRWLNFVVDISRRIRSSLVYGRVRGRRCMWEGGWLVRGVWWKGGTYPQSSVVSCS